MAMDFILQVKIDSGWEDIAAISEQLIDKFDIGFFINGKVENKLLNYPNQKLRLHRMHHDNKEIHGIEVLEINAWSIYRNKVLVLNPNINYHQKMYKYEDWKKIES